MFCRPTDPDRSHLSETADEEFIAGLPEAERRELQVILGDSFFLSERRGLGRRRLVYSSAVRNLGRSTEIPLSTASSDPLPDAAIVATPA